MNKDKKILIMSVVGVLLIASAIVIYVFFNNKEISDGIKIRDEYAELNGKTNSSNKKYPIVNLTNNNPYKFINDKELLELLENGTGLIYFGFSTCPWCRTMLPVLETASSNKDFKTVYYYDVLNVRSKYVLDANNEPEKTVNGSNTYYKLLQILNEYLTDYELTDDDGTAVKTGEKRLFAPTVVAVNLGTIKSVHIGTLDSQKSGYEALTSEQKEELIKIYEEMIDDVTNNVCREEEGC